MFESLKHWLAGQNNDHGLFDHPEDEALHSAVACLLYHVITVDQDESEKQKHKFERWLKDEFHLNHDQAAHLYQKARTLNSDMDADLATIAEHLTNNPMQRLQFMDKLNQLACVNGVDDRELALFEHVKQVLFPDSHSF